jgi:hypothetical protein
MVRIPLEPEGEALAKRVEDVKGCIEFPPAIYYHNVRADSQTQQQYPDLKNFKFMSAKFSVSTCIDPSTRGVKWFLFEGNITDNTHGKTVDIVDRAPKTDWVEGNSKAKLSVKLKFNPVSRAFELLGVPNPVDGGFEYEWNRNPKVGKVIVSGAGNTAGWKFNAASGAYADGTQELILVARAPNIANNLDFTITKAEAEYDVPRSRDRRIFKRAPITIPVNKVE